MFVDEQNVRNQPFGERFSANKNRGTDFSRYTWPTSVNELMILSASIWTTSNDRNIH